MRFVNRHFALQHLLTEQCLNAGYRLLKLRKLGQYESKFPMSIKLPEINIDLVLRKDGMVDMCPSWMNGRDVHVEEFEFPLVNQTELFPVQNPFEYFAARTKTMDSIGIKGIYRHSTGNFITVTLTPENEYLDYIPDDLAVKPHYRNVFDSVIATGHRIGKNWVWRKYP